ncbi:MAG: 4-hydroxythreonine-4-phosphate dehydrogenase PdxA [Candidatus Tectomicrobia bacterium]|uniref:4-hydroxythreonine-4-phosphate dehydrogenase n=1 Tax=Tectimicrobiota bacterium TaxID=2528274 RepID=A0A932CNG8_UNCTE|nr:4-hydroxythreonine-4-phosphate dehydrogenase PdxA [Candidatus Tectomicrobia bacterium]
MEKLPIVAITMGDAGGIGPEILLKAAEREAFTEGCLPLVIGSWAVLQEASRRLGLPLTMRRGQPADWQSLSPGGITVLDLDNLSPDWVFQGRADPETGRAAAEYLLKAVELALAGAIDAIATAPLSKEGLNRGGYPYPGHTELLAALTQTPDYAMMMVGGAWRIVLVTTHMPLREVSASLDREKILRVIRLTHRSISALFGVARPRIAVAALNPHAGEGGLFGREELDHIVPAIEAARALGVEARGPYPADTLFQPQRSQEFDAVVVMYHDQGLIPVKMAAFGEAVNVTIGLPIIRTSVDHGTAYDIAGQGIANPTSLLAAIRLAAQMVR